MHFFREKFRASPIYVRVVPFFIFVGLIAFGSMFGKDGPFWIYALRTFLGAWFIIEMRPFVPEMRWTVSLEAFAIGVAVFIMWVGLDSFVPKNHIFFTPSPDDPVWNPFQRYTASPNLAWFFFLVRLLGSSFVVAPLEEVFWRSFLYRYAVRTNFESLPLKMFHPTSFIVVSFLFGIEHYQFVQGFLCGMAYQWLVINKNRLGDAIAAHAITNFLLGLWVLWRGQWHFW